MTSRLAYNAALDGLRAFAVAGVVVQHAGFEEGGYFGVTVFFVISGYLITSLLLIEHQAQGSIGLTAFYRRRFARLAPALLLVTGVTVIWLLAIGEPFSTWWSGLLGTLTYTTDLLLATPLASHVGGYFEWSWSLGIEEQFYVIWPLLLILLLRVRRGRTWLAVVAFAVVAIAWAQRARLSHGHPSHDRVNFTFDTHMDAIALGAILALALLGRQVGRGPQAVAQVLGLIGCVGLFAIIHQPWQTAKVTTLDLGGYGQAALLCLLIVSGVVMAPSGPLSRFFALGPFVHLGKLSYGIYLWNQVLASGCQHLTGDLPARAGTLGLLLWLAAVVAVAELSYRFVETPLRRQWAARPSPDRVAVWLCR
jgi:peptidoglycan/LPS O-acetylase OafA/YrhL